MATTSEFVGAGESLTDVDPTVLGTAEFRAAIADLGHPAPGAELRFEARPPDWCLTVVVPPTIPWRITELAIVRALDQVRTIRPDLHVTDRRYQPPEPAG